MSDPTRPAPDAFVKICPSRAVFARLGEKWSMLVLAALGTGRLRFGDLRRRLEGISQKVLSQTLRNLERDGLLVRHPHDERPARVEYELTPRGHDLLPHVLAMKAWAEINLHAILASHAAFDAQVPNERAEVRSR